MTGCGGVIDWKSATVVAESDLTEFLFEPLQDVEARLHVKAYSIRPTGNRIREDDFVRYLAEEFPKYVYSKTEYDRGYLDYSNAVDQVSPDSIESGFVGEYLLYLLTEGALDLPVVLRKVQTNQARNMPVHGADGFFIGNFEDEPCIAPGEAKTHSRLSGGIRDVLSDVEEFLESGPANNILFELPVVSKANEEFYEEHLDEIMRLFQNPLPEDYNLVHPVVICHEFRQLDEDKDGIPDENEMERKIREDLDSLEYVSKIKENKQYDPNHEIILIFMFLPVPNLTRFRESVYGAIFDGVK